MLARITTYALHGVDSHRVTAEVDVRSGLPAFTIVGLADRSVREARERVRSALQNSGFDFPQMRITVNLAPASLRKAGPGFDLAIACGILAASEQVDPASLETRAVFGELSLGGELRPCRGALAVAEGAARDGLTGLLVPSLLAAEAALVDDLAVSAATDLRDVVAALLAASSTRPPRRRRPSPRPRRRAGGPDLADVRGHAQALSGARRSPPPAGTTS